MANPPRTAAAVSSAFAICLALAGACGAAAPPDAAPSKPQASLFSRDNLVAWCIVPFDAKHRTPEQRAEMLDRIGLHRFAYDWREQHLPTFEAELAALEKHDVELTAVWFPAELNKDARLILGALKKHRLKPQLWVMTQVEPGKDQEKGIAQAADLIRPVAREADAIGCKVALYNHGGWFGEPENEIAIIERLRRDGVANVGMVYNLHHGHEHLARFPELLAKMKPHLLALNLNGTNEGGDKAGEKILPLGQGKLDVRLLKTIRDSGWTGPVGILNHTDEDAEGRLLDNLDGLDWLLPQLDGKPAGPVPKLRTYHAAQAVNFPLRVSDNRRHLVDAAGKPFFLLADTPWFLQKLKIEDVRHILDDRKARGFNTLFLEILDDSAMPSRDAYGNVAFEPGTDITRPVEAYWRYADEVMEEAERRGFFVIQSDLWFGAGEGLWMHHVTPESAGAYGKFLGKRYARFKNVTWMHCGDRNPEGPLAECTRRLAAAIRRAAPHQLQTAHLSPEFASAAYFAKDAWLDVNMAYTYGASYLHVFPEYQRTDPVRPVLLGETGYEAEPNAIERLPDAKKGDLWNPYRIRRNAYWALLSGACGYCAGTRLWRFEPNWREVLDAESIRQAPLIRRLFESVPWWRLVPDAGHAVVTAGYGTWKDADYVTAAIADDGTFAIAYLPSAREVSVDVSKLKGKVAARWFDPTDGACTQAGGQPFAGGPTKKFSPPNRNKAGQDDWVLILEGGR